MSANESDERILKQQRTFDAFLRTQPYEIRSGWTNRGLGPPIDFVNAELKIGVELTEWRGQDQSQWVEERDRFRSELLTAITEKGLTQFGRGTAGFTAQIYLENGPPSRHRKPAIINQLLNFLVNFVRSAPSRLSPYWSATITDIELPSELRPYIQSITVYVFVTGNLGIVVSAGRTTYDPSLPEVHSTVALDAFRERLTEKAISGAERYAREKALLGLQQLWLVVHYSSPGVFVEPLTELHIEIGYGDHRHQSQRTAAIQLRNIANEIGCGPFDRIYFLVDCQPDPFSELIQSA
jgi:hypothetical protein